MNTNVKRGDVYWISLDPTIGSETKKHGCVSYFPMMHKIKKARVLS